MLKAGVDRKISTHEKTFASVVLHMPATAITFDLSDTFFEATGACNIQPTQANSSQNQQF
jgi:hypothetical protein